MEETVRKKIKKIFSFIPDEYKPEAVLIFNGGLIDKNFFYITGQHQGVFENCGVLFEEQGRMYLLTTTLEQGMLDGLSGCFQVLVYREKQHRDQKLRQVLSGYQRIGLCFDSISHSFYTYLSHLVPDVQFVDVGRCLKMARMTKFPEEIKNIATACKMVQEIAERIPLLFKRGITELEMAAEVDYLVKKKGAHGHPFKTIVSFGENTAKPHYSGSGVPLENGDVVLVDFGAEYRGYASDITHTYFTGTPEEGMVGMYNTVLRAQEMALEMIGEGTGCEYVEDEVRKFIDSHPEFRGRFIHSLGHSLGLEAHDDSYPSEEFQKKFRQNMVLTVEPGVYIPGRYGVRLEDDIVVEKDGCRVLTSRNKQIAAYEI
ncbi:MAG: M24 family metallopeptidase [Spirochaetota bacterium]